MSVFTGTFPENNNWVHNYIMRIFNHHIFIQTKEKQFCMNRSSVHRIGLIVSMFFLLSGICTTYGCTSKELEPDPEPPVDTTPAPSGKRDIEVWMTRPDQTALFRNQVVALSFGPAATQQSTITVDTTSTFQTMDGFGFSLTGGSAYHINRLASTQRDAIIRELFSTDSGCIGISYLRISIGASDLDASVFSYCDLPAGQTDPELKQFSIENDRDHLIPVLKQALIHNPSLRIMATPWSPPVWMKTNKNSIGGSLLKEFYPAYANYFVRYIQAMEAEGIPIDAITPQNEPLHPGNNPSMLMPWNEQLEFIRDYLGPAFEKAKLDTKIVVYDHNCDHPEYATQILQDPDARKFIDGSAFHLYAGDISALSQVHNAHPDKNVYFTEQWVGGPSNFSGDMKWHMKNLIIGAPRNWSKNVLEWNLASDPYYKPHTPGGCTSCEGALTIFSSVSRNVSYYIIAHASRFVRPGSVRINSNMPTNLPNVAFKTPDGSKVLIVLNEGNSSVTFNISQGSRNAVATLSAGATATYVWK